MNHAEIFRTRLFCLLKKKGIMQMRLAEEIGVSHSCLSDWKSGRSSLPTASVLIKLAMALDCSIDYLVGLSDFKEDKHSEIINEVKA